MKAFSLAGLRISTGLLILVWGLIRVGAPEMGAHVSEKYYAGIGSSETIQMVWGGSFLLLGTLSILGLFRRHTLTLQAIILVTGALSIWKYLLDPLGLYLLTRETSQVLFFPSLGIAFASLVLIAFREDDRYALDSWLERRRSSKIQD